jgi:hypothetical protein
MMQTRSDTRERCCDDPPTKHMSKLLLFVATVGALASVALCATYGLDQASVLKDQVIIALNYAMVALFSFVLHIGAVRAWVLGWRKTGVLACIVGLLLFVATVLLSTSGLASRADRLLAERQEVLDGRADIKAQIDTLLAEKAVMKFTRISQALWSTLPGARWMKPLGCARQNVLTVIGSSEAPNAVPRRSTRWWRPLGWPRPRN